MTSRKASAVVALAILFHSSGSFAQERKAYKYVDEKGNVTYSQVPPASGKGPSKIDITPSTSARRASRPDADVRSLPAPSSDPSDYREVHRELARRRAMEPTPSPRPYEDCGNCVILESTGGMIRRVQ